MRIGLFCSGGDAPGMNACLRAVVRSAAVAGHEVVGIRNGYQGLLEEDFERCTAGGMLLSPCAVSGLVSRGGTLLGTSRSDEFRTPEGQRKAADTLRRHQIDALVPIGGDGTFHGALALAQYWSGQIIGCPGTIDNDLLGTDYTIGFHTAVTTAVEAVDKLRDTAESHQRIFLIEVMGRHSGYIGLFTALAAGAEMACVPETLTDVPHLIEQFAELRQRGKRSILVIVAEGDEAGGALRIQEQLAAAGCKASTRVVILGHLQRGGAPVVADRLLASRLGDFAVRMLAQGHSGAMAGELRGELVLTPLAEAVADTHKVPQDWVQLLDVLAY